MTKFFNKFKKFCSWPIFGPFSQFSKKLMIRFQENTRTGGRADELYYIGFFWLHPGFQQDFKINSSKERFTLEIDNEKM